MHKFLLFIPLSFSFLAQPAAACIEYHPDSIIVNVIADSTCNLELRITNLRLGAGNAAQFCSCGIGNFISSQVVIDYITFVDSITGIPVPGFDGFAFLASAGISWADVDPQTFDWEGFVSDVNEAGIAQDHAVDLVIRGHLLSVGCLEQLLGESGPEGFTGPSVLASAAFGTDEWNPAEDYLMQSHNDITYFSDVPAENWRYTQVDEAYFIALDNLLNSVAEALSADLRLFPNPATDRATLTGLRPGDRISILTGTGTEVSSFTATATTATISTADLSAGIYLVRIQTAEGQRGLRLVVR